MLVCRSKIVATYAMAAFMGANLPIFETPRSSASLALNSSASSCNVSHVSHSDVSHVSHVSHSDLSTLDLVNITGEAEESQEVGDSSVSSNAYYTLDTRRLASKHKKNQHDR